LKDCDRSMKRIRRVIWMFFSVAMIVLAGNGYGSEEFGGLGMMVAQLYDVEVENGRGDIVVLGVLPKSPAAKAGVRAGDTITHIDGEAVLGRTFDDIVTGELRGLVGTTSKLTIRRPLKENPIYVVLKRVRITSPVGTQ
jgi:C-terminal processing protease CtpA/Prc